VVVVDPEGRPVADAYVVACSEASEVTLRSASDGTVAFGPGASGCAARAHHARFAHSSPARLHGDGLVVLRLERGGAIEGVATDSNGAALHDGDISVSGFEPSEDEQPLAGSLPELRLPIGREFRFSGLAPGTYTLTVVRRVHLEDMETSEELATASYEVVAGHAVRGVHVVAEAGEAPVVAPVVVPIVVPTRYPIRRAPTLRTLVPTPPLVELGS
jgi:hypothetical protein